ncbi:MAG TPA: serine hydrolase domain-containing protein [Thermomicrobiales bacterium]|nr:serine hydrolase domain-containing protein [Thermomicrobiales bacterium]
MNASSTRLERASLTRRRALQLTASGAAVAGLGLRSAFAQSDATPVPGATPISGDAMPELSRFDTIITEMMAKWSLPGGQLAISHGDRLVFNRGYGYASIEDREAVSPTSRFRIASNTKPITGVAILQLIDAGRLTLDTPVFPLLNLPEAPNAPKDPRLDSITVEQLLVHAGGWDSASTGMDPQYLPYPLMASHIFRAEDPAEAKTIVRYMQGQPLDFDPGTKSAYSNFGFNVLGRVIERVSGLPYEQFVIENTLTPAGITSMAIGGTTLAERLPEEVRYYSPEGLEPRPSVYPGEGYVPVGYGSFYLRSLDAHGGWIATAADMVQFALAIDGTRGTALLTPESVKAMEETARPKAAAAGAGNTATATGLAFNTMAADGGWQWTHAGALEGSNSAWLLRTPKSTIAFVFNTLPRDLDSFFGEIIPALQRELTSTTTWPTTDLFT